MTKFNECDTTCMQTSVQFVRKKEIKARAGVSSRIWTKEANSSIASTMGPFG